MTDEARLLLERAHENLQAAKLLENQGYLDIAASRAYYAMFYAAQALLLQRGLAFSSHSAVIAAFGREIAKKRVLDAKYHRYLIDAQDLRNLADYGVKPALTRETVSAVIERATEFVAQTEGVASSKC